MYIHTYVRMYVRMYVCTYVRMYRASVQVHNYVCGLVYDGHVKVQGLI